MRVKLAVNYSHFGNASSTQFAMVKSSAYTGPMILAPDAFPELTRALRPDSAYDFLVRVAHPWRRQLFVKGRRQTAAQLVADMRANDWDIDRTAAEFDLDRRAVVEALHYCERNQSLIAAEIAEERRRVEPYLYRAPAAR